MNLALFGVPLQLFPRALLFARRHLIQRRWSRLYFLPYFLAQAYILGFRIYPMRYSFFQLLKKMAKSFPREIHKHFQSK